LMWTSKKFNTIILFNLEKTNFQMEPNNPHVEMLTILHN
jgi:hypothetical protein